VRTVNGIWASIIDYENLYKAYRKAAKGKRYSFESMKFRRDLEENLIQIQNELIWKTYTPRPLRLFTIFEPKKREIAAPSFRDRLVHHALVSVIEPHFEKRFINDSFACRKGRGTHAAMYKMRKFCRDAKRCWGSYWVLKCDVRKYFPSINHSVLKKAIRRKIFDKDTLWLIDTIIDSFGRGVGIPIGALTSQLFANIYLDQLDHYVKEKMRVRFFVRYMDDFCILGNAKKELQETLSEIEGFLGGIGLHLNDRTGIWPCRHGVDMCGYRIWHSHVKPRKRTVIKIKKDLRGILRRYHAKEASDRIKVRLVSFLGYIKHCCGYKVTMAVLKRVAQRRRKGEVYVGSNDIRKRGCGESVSGFVVEKYGLDADAGCGVQNYKTLHR
jgi:retron-type reverse transcriptase